MLSYLILFYFVLSLFLFLFVFLFLFLFFIFIFILFLFLFYFIAGLANQSLTHTEKEKIPPPVGDPTMIFKPPTTDRELIDMSEKITAFIELGKYQDFWRVRNRIIFTFKSEVNQKHTKTKQIQKHKKLKLIKTQTSSNKQNQNKHNI
jgi:hypothetical protein